MLRFPWKDIVTNTWVYDHVNPPKRSGDMMDVIKLHHFEHFVRKVNSQGETGYTWTCGNRRKHLFGGISELIVMSMEQLNVPTIYRFADAVIQVT